MESTLINKDNYFTEDLIRLAENNKSKFIKFLVDNDFQKQNKEIIFIEDKGE